MSQDPLVSVIVPAFNRAKYIDEAVNSVLNQTYGNIELIVVDDGSTDGTYERLQAYGDRLLLLTHPNRANRGQSCSINLGMTRATGQYIALLDSDDYWELDKLRIQVDFLERHPEFGLVYSNGYYVDAGGRVLYPYHRKDHVEPNDPNAVLLDCYMALPVNSLVRSSVYRQVGGFEESFRASQDHDMLIRIAEVTRFAYIPDFLFSYRRHGESISQTKQEVRWRTGFEILQRARSRYPYRPSTLRKRLALLNYRMGQVYLSHGKRLASLPFWLKAGLLDPVRSLKVVLGLGK